jgi:type I restriction enzyme M protein
LLDTSKVVRHTTFMRNQTKSFTQTFLDLTRIRLNGKFSSDVISYELALVLLAVAKALPLEKYGSFGNIKNKLSELFKGKQPDSDEVDNFLRALGAPLSKIDDIRSSESSVADELACHAADCVGQNSRFLIEDLLPRSNRELEAVAIPQSLACFMVELLEIKDGTRVYAPWDSFTQLSSEIFLRKGLAEIETPLETSTTFLLKYLTDAQFKITQSDPIKKQYSKALKNDERYVASVACAPIGLFHNHHLSQYYPSNRFPEETQNSTILALRHLQFITSERIVVLVPYSFLFARGSEKEVRKDLLSKGQIKAVVGLPQNFLAPKAPSFAILVLDQSEKTENVLFWELGDIRPYERGSAKLKKFDLCTDRAHELVALLKSQTSDKQLPLGYNKVAVKQLLDDNANLSVDRQYSRSPQARDTGYRETKTIGSIFKIIRPPRFAATKVDSKVDEILEAVREVTAADLPDFAFVERASKLTTISVNGFEKFSDAFVKENDIILIHKGSVGKVGMIHRKSKVHKSRWVVGQSGLILRAASENEEVTAIFMFLRSQRGQALFSSIVSGSTTPFFTLTDLVTLGIPHFLNKEIVNATSAFERECEIQEKLIDLNAEQAQLSQDIWSQL